LDFPSHFQFPLELFLFDDQCLGRPQVIISLCQLAVFFLQVTDDGIICIPQSLAQHPRHIIGKCRLNPQHRIEILTSDFQQADHRARPHTRRAAVFRIEQRHFAEALAGPKDRQSSLISRAQSLDHLHRAL